MSKPFPSPRELQLERMKYVGGQLANAAYGMACQGAVDVNGQQLLRDLVKQWDEAAHGPRRKAEAKTCQAS
jgi:hypothetical protein